MKFDKSAELVKKIRLCACLTQKQFGEKIGVNRLTISFYENGRRIPRIDKLQKIIAIAKENGLNPGYDDFR